MSASKHNPLVRAAVDRRVTMGTIVAGLLVLGWISLGRLPLEFLPSFSSSNISVIASYPSASPAEIERLIARPLEDSLGTINGIETLSTSASASSARIRVGFVDGTDMDLAAVDVRDRVDRVRHRLPDDLDRISIRRFQSTDIPVLRFDLSATWPETRLYEFAETVVQRRLERIEGVAQIDVDGLRTPLLQVDLDPARLQAHGIDVRDLAATLRDNNVNLTAGELRDDGRVLLVRAVGEYDTPAAIARLPLAGGLRLGDVADVVYGFPPQEDHNFLNGVEALTVRVNKASTANLLEVVDAVKAEIAAIERLPAFDGAAIRIYADASRDVRLGLGQLRDAGLIGGLLAICAVWLFLRRVRTTLLIALSIPISLVTTFVLLFALRQAGAIDTTINVVSLAGLMLALGMLVDNSIVVIESIFRHRNELGSDARTAALEGASEVALPIVASTLTTLCVFLPLIFLGSGGRFALYFRNIAVTICIVIVASLAVALTVVPMAAALILRGQTARRAPFVARLGNWYGGVLRFTLRHRLAFVVSIVLMFAGSVYLFTTIERSFASRQLEREIIVKVDTPRQYSFEQIEALYTGLYDRLDAERERLDIADIAHAYDRGTGRSRASWRRTRQFNVYLKDESDSTVTTAEARDRIRALLPDDLPGVQLRLASGPGRHGFSGVEVELAGPDPAVLRLLAGRVADRLGELPMIRDVDTSLESGDREIHVRPSAERALQAGLSGRAVAATVGNALSARAISQFKTDDGEVDLVMQFREADRETLEQLERLPVGSGPAALPLGALASFAVVEGPQTIERENHLAQVSITANARSAGASFAALGAVRSVLEREALPPGYEWSFGRWNRYQQRDQGWGTFALLFALPLVYMLLAALFESFTQPFAIMFSVPFALLGVGVVMKLAGQPLDNMTTIGMIVLLGVVVNNAIVLIDHINLLRRQGLERTEAIVAGGIHRLRPIVITAVTTILGMLPLIAPILLPAWFGPLEGRAATWAPIGLVIVGGLTTSTFLTLVILPTLYSLIDDLTEFVRRVARAA